MGAADVSQLWRQLIEALASVAPMITDDLYPAADDAAIERLRAGLTVPLPAEMEALYRINNGEGRLGVDYESPAFLFWVANPLHVRGRNEYYFMPIDGVVAEFAQLKMLPNDIKWLEHHGPVRPASDGWIPFANDFGGNFLCIDCDPDAGGTPGQIIELVLDENNLGVVSSGLTEFLACLLSHARQ